MQVIYKSNEGKETIINENTETSPASAIKLTTEELFSESEECPPYLREIAFNIEKHFLGYEDFLKLIDGKVEYLNESNKNTYRKLAGIYHSTNNFRTKKKQVSRMERLVKDISLYEEYVKGELVK